jgi:hypothetical protein
MKLRSVWLGHGDEYHGNEWIRISSERGWTRHRMSLIESRNNPVSLTKGMLYGVRSNRCWYPECTGVIMGIQVPLMIIDCCLCSVMTGVFSDRRVTHLRARWNRRPFRNHRSNQRIRETISEEYRIEPKQVRSEPEVFPEHREME